MQFQASETPVRPSDECNVNFLKVGTPTTSLSDVEVARCPDSSLSHQENLWITPVNITEDVSDLSSRFSGVDDKAKRNMDPLSSFFPDVYSTPVATAHLSDSLPYSPSQPILSDISQPSVTKYLGSPNSPDPDLEFFTPMSQMKSRLLPNDNQISKLKPKQLATEYLDLHKNSSDDKYPAGVRDSTKALIKVCKSVGKKSVLKTATSSGKSENCAFMDGYERKGESNKADLSANLSTVIGGTILKISEPLLETYESCAKLNSSNSVMFQAEDIEEVKSFCKYKDKNRDFETVDPSSMNMTPDAHSSEVDVKSSRVNHDTENTGPSQIMKIKAKDVGVQKKMVKRGNCVKVATAPRLKVGKRGKPIKVSSDCVPASKANTEVLKKDKMEESECNTDVNLPVMNDYSTENEMQKINIDNNSVNQSQNIEIEEKQPTCNESETIEVHDPAVVDSSVTKRKRGRPKKSSLGSQSYTSLEPGSSQDTGGISPTVTDDVTECRSLLQEESVVKEKSRRLRRSSFEIYKVFKEEVNEKVAEENQDSGNVLQYCNGKLAPVSAPRKRKKSNTEEDIAKIYTSKDYVPLPTKALETISESPIISKKARKLKRLIEFGSFYHIPSIKQKKRQQKAAKMGWDARKVRKNKIPDDVAQQKLQSIWEDLEKD